MDQVILSTFLASVPKSRKLILVLKSRKGRVRVVRQMRRILVDIFRQFVSYFRRLIFVSVIVCPTVASSTGICSRFFLQVESTKRIAHHLVFCIDSGIVAMRCL